MGHHEGHHETQPAVNPVAMRGCVLLLGVLVVAALACGVVPYLLLPSAGIGMATYRVGVAEVVLKHSLETANVDISFIRLQKLSCPVGAKEAIRGDRFKDINQICPVS